MTIKNKKKPKDKSGYLGNKFFLDRDTGKFVMREVTAKTIGPNTYYFTGKKQLVCPFFSTKEEAMMGELKRLDQEILDQHNKLGHLINTRMVLNAYLAHQLGFKKASNERAKKSSRV